MAANFVKQRRKDLIEMIKYKLLFGIFFLFAFQLSYSLTQNVDEQGFVVGIEAENQPQFDKTYFAPNIAGEIPKNQFDILDYSHPSKCFLSNYNSKDLQVSFIQGYHKYNAVALGLISGTCLNKGLVNIPIYLQTEKFRL